MATQESFRQLMQQMRDQSEYWSEWLVSDFVSSLELRMSELRLSRRELAERLDVSPAYITKALRGRTNFTVESMAKFARAVDSVVRVHLAPIGSSTRWMDVYNGPEVPDCDNASGQVEFVTDGTAVPAAVRIVASGGS